MSYKLCSGQTGQVISILFLVWGNLDQNPQILLLKREQSVYHFVYQKYIHDRHALNLSVAISSGIYAFVMWTYYCICTSLLYTAMFYLRLNPINVIFLSDLHVIRDEYYLTGNKTAKLLFLHIWCCECSMNKWVIVSTWTVAMKAQIMFVFCLNWRALLNECLRAG